MPSAAARVLVVGSLNLDYIAFVDRLPAPGQTIAATSLIRRFGGKGANQAIAAARQGAEVSMIGCVGDDDDGRAYLRRMRAEWIDVKGVARTAKARTGTALIAVDQQAENLIIVSAGANGQVTRSAVRAAHRTIARANSVLLQFEVPMDAVLAAIECSNAAGTPVILNPSPLRKGFPWGRYSLDTLIVNEGEAARIFGLNSEAAGTAWSGATAKLKARHLIITRGPHPTLCFTSGERLEFPTLAVKPVDTVGAGDAFAGAYSAHRAEGLELASAIQLANCAGALTTLKAGAQEAIPRRQATLRAARALR